MDYKKIQPDLFSVLRTNVRDIPGNNIPYVAKYKWSTAVYTRKSEKETVGRSALSCLRRPTMNKY